MSYSVYYCTLHVQNESWMSNKNYIWLRDRFIIMQTKLQLWTPMLNRLAMICIKFICNEPGNYCEHGRLMQQAELPKADYRGQTLTHTRTSSWLCLVNLCSYPDFYVLGKEHENHGNIQRRTSHVLCMLCLRYSKSQKETNLGCTYTWKRTWIVTKTSST